MSATHKGVRLSDPSTFTQAEPARGFIHVTRTNRGLERAKARRTARAEHAAAHLDRQVKGMGHDRALTVLGSARFDALCVQREKAYTITVKPKVRTIAFNYVALCAATETHGARRDKNAAKRERRVA